MNLNEKPTVLILDDDSSNLDSFVANFRRNYEIMAFSNPLEALKALDHSDVQIVVTDQNMPLMKGVDFLTEVSTRHPKIMRILLTGSMDIETALDAVNRAKVCSIITKPFDVKAISDMIGGAYEEFKAQISKDTLIKTLQKQNQQFEFMLRQKRNS